MHQAFAVNTHQLLGVYSYFFLHRSQVDDRRRQDFGLVCCLSRLAGPGFVSMSIDSISLYVAELLL